MSQLTLKIAGRASAWLSGLSEVVELELVLPAGGDLRRLASELAEDGEEVRVFPGTTRVSRYALLRIKLSDGRRLLAAVPCQETFLMNQDGRTVDRI